MKFFTRSHGADDTVNFKPVKCSLGDTYKEDVRYLQSERGICTEGASDDGYLHYSGHTGRIGKYQCHSGVLFSYEKTGQQVLHTHPGLCGSDWLCDQRCLLSPRRRLPIHLPE